MEYWTNTSPKNHSNFSEGATNQVDHSAPKKDQEIDFFLEESCVCHNKLAEHTNAFFRLVQKDVPLMRE